MTFNEILSERVKRGKGMRITLDIPDTTMCAFINYVFWNKDTYGISMGVKSLDSNDLVDGNEIKADPYKGGDTE